MKSNEVTNWPQLLIVGIAVVFVLQLLGSSGCDTGPSGTYDVPRSPSDPARRYVEGRFRQEGYSAQDSATAAEAVLKFQRAQDARRNR